MSQTTSTAPGTQPPDVRKLATEYQLGTKVRSYAHAKSTYPSLIVAALIIGLCGLLMLGLGLWMTYQSFAVVPAGETIASYNNGGGIVLLVLGIFLTLIGIFLLLAAYWLSRSFREIVRAGGLRTVHIYKNGVIFANKKNADVLSWDQVTGVAQNITRRYVNGIPTRTTYQYTLSTADKHTFILPSTLEDIKQLGEEVTQEVTKRQLPLLLQSYNRGETVRFGALGLNQQGIVTGQPGNEKLLPWGETGGAKLLNGKVLVMKKGQFIPWTTLPVPSVTNVSIFLTFIKQANTAR